MIKVCGIKLKDQQYIDLMRYVKKIGIDTWNSLPYADKQSKINELINKNTKVKKTKKKR